MFDLVTPETFWLTVVNVALGLVCLACVALVVGALVRDVMERRKAAADAKHPVADDHAFLVPGLGATMADGGERLPDDRSAF